MNGSTGRIERLPEDDASDSTSASAGTVMQDVPA